jgi:hypothetical protein
LPAGSPTLIAFNEEVVVSSAGRAIGLDVHLEFCEVAVCENGQVRSVGSRGLRACSAGAVGGESVGDRQGVLEVMGAAWEIVRILEPHVAKVIVVSPGDTGIAHARAKTDRLDARTLARLLWMGELDGCGHLMSTRACCAAGCRGASSWCGRDRGARTRSTQC